MIFKLVLGLCLYTAFLLLCYWSASESILRRLRERAAVSLDMAARNRSRENRRLLVQLGERNGLLYQVERMLVYSGLSVRFRKLTPELFLLFDLALCAAGYFGGVLLWQSSFAGIAAAGGLQLVLYMTVCMMRNRNFRMVNQNLMKFLDFLGNYSLTAGELTGVLHQISRYMDEPLRQVLEECYYEAQVSGDSSLALLSMAEKIEHPRFKELVWNMEISVRYCADFKALVKNSKRAVREHMRTSQERKSMINEAMVNLLLLAGMSVVILVMVEKLTGADVQQILFHSVPGRICLMVILLIFALLYQQIRRLEH